MYLTFFDHLLYSGFMKNKIFVWEQSLVTFAVFGLIGGFLESYTFVLHGNVFCNAQTGNLVLLVINLIDGKAAVSLKYLFSILAYAAGILLSVVIPRKIKAISRSTFMTFLEILVLVGLAFIPSSASNYYARTIVAFLCAVQYNTFTHCHGAAISTTFCTNNLRQMTLHLYDGIKLKSKESAKKAGIYAYLIAFFVLGAAVGVFASENLGNYSVLVCAAPLLPLFAFMVAEDFKKTKQETE